MKLTSENVQELFKTCLYGKDPSSAKDQSEVKKVEGIVHAFAFSTEKLNEHKDDILDMLSELPENFRKESGGGWSFLQACVNNSGEQWTGEHLIMEQLFALGMGLDAVQYLLPRNLWTALPGGVPYIVFDDPRNKETEGK